MPDDEERERLIQRKIEELRRMMDANPFAHDADMVPGAFSFCVPPDDDITLEAVQRLQEQEFIDVINGQRGADRALSPDQVQEVSEKIRKLRDKFLETGEIPPDEPLSF